MAACSKDDGPVGNPDADRTTLTGFSFKKADNSGLNSNITSCTSGNMIYVTVPEDVSLSSLVPSFTIGQGASLTINGIPVENETTPCDFSKTSKIVVTSESGLTRSYTLLARNGNPKIDNMVYEFMAAHSIPGVSIAISKEEETV
ncbi:MAG: hypothetical protein IIW25_03145, partial [Bacteroidales bacterium]|nr:hypothetical protein [Bacteroidales bacterium]